MSEGEFGRVSEARLKRSAETSFITLALHYASLRGV